MTRGGAMREAIWIGTGIGGVVAVATAFAAGLSFAGSTWAIGCGFAAAAMICRKRLLTEWGLSRDFAVVMDALVLLALAGIFGSIFSYAALALTRGWTDAALVEADRAIGFDWPAAWGFVAHRQWLFTLLFFAYRACGWLPFAIALLLYRAGRPDRLYPYLAANGIALVATLATFWFWPARAAFVTHCIGGPAPSAHLGAYDISITALHMHTRTVIDLSVLEGLITFPSFHAVMAILFVWAAWPISRGWRVALLVLNALMWVSAVPIGGHYAVDMIGGSAIAVASIALVRWIEAGRRLGLPGSRSVPGHGALGIA